MRIVTLAVVLACSMLACAKKETPAANTSSSATSTAAEEKKPFKEISVDEVDQRVAKKDGKTFVFDANPKEVFDKHHVPGAVYVPDEGVTASLLPADKNATLIFYCANTY
jgi:ABC-type enterochelin transport system substrate-binding protein